MASTFQGPPYCMFYPPSTTELIRNNIFDLDKVKELVLADKNLDLSEPLRHAASVGSSLVAHFLINQGATLPQSSQSEMKPTRKAIIDLIGQRQCSSSEDKAACDAKSNTMWECIHREKGPSGGYIYSFVPTQTAHDKDHSAYNKLFPALEPNLPVFQTLFNHIQKNKWEDKSLPTTTHYILKRLGLECYLSDPWVLLTLPDEVELLRRWQDLKKSEEFSHLPDLRITSSEGIAGDMEFAAAYLKFDALTSNGVEFIHDWVAHVLEVILTAIYQSSPTHEYSQEEKIGYQKQRDLLVNRIYPLYKPVDDLKKVIMSTGWSLFTNEERTFLEKNLPLMERVIGACADMNASSIFSLEGSLKLTIKGILSRLLESRPWEIWLGGQFRKDLLNPTTLEQLWDRIKEISDTIYQHQQARLDRSYSDPKIINFVSANINHRRFIADFPSGNNPGSLFIIPRMLTTRLPMTDREIEEFAKQIKADLSTEDLEAVKPLLLALHPKFEGLLNDPSSPKKLILEQVYHIICNKLNKLIQYIDKTK